MRMTEGRSLHEHKETAARNYNFCVAGGPRQVFLSAAFCLPAGHRTGHSGLLSNGLIIDKHEFMKRKDVQLTL
jgi:hypothetical protein